VFRAAHTIKGGAGVVEIHSVEKFTHVLENVLDRLRNGEIEVNGDMISALLLGCDHIGTLLDMVQPRANRAGRRNVKRAGDAIAEQLRPFLGAKARRGGKEVTVPTPTCSAATAKVASTTAGTSPSVSAAMC
jgi:two-component system chemotaxis sensor kinase CheA